VSSELASKTDIDALVTIALQWTEDGHVDAMPEPARTVLRVTPEHASEIGRDLWQANADAFYFGGPPSTATRLSVQKRKVRWCVERAG
jgi:hypothetical protein